MLHNLLNQKYALAKLRAELEGRGGRICQCCRKFGHLAHNCRNRKGEPKGKPTPQNKFEVIASRVMQCGVKEEVEIKRQEMVEGVKCFRCWEGEYYKWKYPNIEVERKRRREEKAAHVARPQNVLENAQLLELGWITEEVIVTYIEWRWYRKKGIYREDNRGQGVFKGRKLEEAEWCRCPK